MVGKIGKCAAVTGVGVVELGDDVRIGGQSGVKTGQIRKQWVGVTDQRLGIEEVDVADGVVSPLQTAQGDELTGYSGPLSLG